jgi:hypothetical protein
LILWAGVRRDGNAGFLLIFLRVNNMSESEEKAQAVGTVTVSIDGIRRNIASALSDLGLGLERLQEEGVFLTDDDPLNEFDALARLVNGFMSCHDPDNPGFNDLGDRFDVELFEVDE